MEQLDNYCAYCLKSHKNKCFKDYRKSPCLFYERDPKGTWKTDNLWLAVDLGAQIPSPGETIEVTFRNCGIDKNIKIYGINNADWDVAGKGLQGIFIKIRCGYWTEEGGIIPDKQKKPELKVIKGGV